MSTELWERWVASTTEPQYRIKRGAKIRVEQTQHTVGGGVLPGMPPVTYTRARKWITFPDVIDGVKVIIDMPENATTKPCDQRRHRDCRHRLGAAQEGGVILKVGLPGFHWRCGCPCHNDPAQAGMLL
jgi:hypothetical protein